MHGIPRYDANREIDWGKTSADYSNWRPDYPPEFYDRLSARGIGRPQQRILDLGTGVGFLARQFAQRGAEVVGIDVSTAQIQTARRDAQSAGLSIEFRVAAAEETGFQDDSFDVITASQCFLYFDQSRAISEVKRLLRPGGQLVTCHFCWLPREDAIAKASEELVLRYNPDWSAADWSGVIPPAPVWSEGHFEVIDRIVFDADIRFSREAWRGRIRACRGVGATLSAEVVSRFDQEHAELLARIAPPEFTVRHRIDAHLMSPM